MATLAKLYAQAKKAGFSSSEIRGKNAGEIEELLAGKNGNSKPAKKSKAAVKKAVKAVAKKRGRPAGSKNKSKADATPAKKKRGRPKGSTSKPKAAKSNGNGGNGRHLLSSVNYNKTEGWSPREGSAPDRIIKALKKFKGDRAKVFDHLKSDIWDFMGKTKRNGEKRTKAEAEDMLKYRIARTEWQFALQTGQHEVATDRADYGTAGTGAGTFKPAKKGKNSKAASKPSKGKNSKPKAAKGNSKSKSSGSSDARKEAKAMSTAQLKKVVKAVEGKRGRPSALVLAARKELEKR